MEPKKLGLIINPVAGLGGSVGLKGSDGMAAEAIRRGAVPQAESRARKALEALCPLQEQITVFTGPGVLGENIAKVLGFSCELMRREPSAVTTAQDTRDLSGWLQEMGVDLILFAGGDGTARDICSTAQEGSVFLGIPAGVKIHSPVYACSPSAAGRLAALYLEGRVSQVWEEEVLDIDEEDYRREVINTRLYGYLTIPKEKHLTQNRKCGTSPSEAACIASLAAKAADLMEPDVFYLIGAGTTTRAIMAELGLPNTLIGVDLVYNRKLVQNDVYGNQILSLVGDKPVKLMVTVTGGQGFLFGRGNQQLTPDVLRRIGRENLMIFATKEKLFQLRGRPLLVDTGDTSLDDALSGYYPVICSYQETVICRVCSI